MHLFKNSESINSFITHLHYFNLLFLKVISFKCIVCNVNIYFKTSISFLYFMEQYCRDSAMNDKDTQTQEVTLKFMQVLKVRNGNKLKIYENSLGNRDKEIKQQRDWATQVRQRQTFYTIGIKSLTLNINGNHKISTSNRAPN